METFYIKATIIAFVVLIGLIVCAIMFLAARHGARMRQLRFQNIDHELRIDAMERQCILYHHIISMYEAKDVPRSIN